MIAGNGEHHDLRLIRNNGIDHHRLLIQDQLGKLLLQIQITFLSVQSDIVTVP